MVTDLTVLTRPLFNPQTSSSRSRHELSDRNLGAAKAEMLNSMLPAGWLPTRPDFRQKFTYVATGHTDATSMD